MRRPATPPTGQLLLPGQAAAPDGPVDLTAMWVVHHGFRRDLRHFADAVGATPVEDRATWRALAARWRLFATVLHHHHSGEDAGLWPVLQARADAAGEAGTRATLAAMADEHAGIDPLLAECAAGFHRLAAGPDDQARARLLEAVASAHHALSAHLAHEERDAMPVLQAHLRPAEWQRIGAEHFDAAYSRRELLGVAAWALHGLPPAAVARLRAQPRGRLLVTAWRVVLRRPFERRERRVFRYGTPPRTDTADPARPWEPPRGAATISPADRAGS